MKLTSDLSLLDILSNGLAGVFILLLIFSVKIGNKGSMEEVAVSEFGKLKQFEPVIEPILEKEDDNPRLVSIYITVWNGEINFNKDAHSSIRDSITIYRGQHKGTEHNWFILRKGPLHTKWDITGNIISQPDSITITWFRGHSPAGDMTCVPTRTGVQTFFTCYEGVNFNLDSKILCKK